MSEKSPQILAEQFVSAAIRDMIIPRDDVGLDDWSDWRRIFASRNNTTLIMDLQPIIAELPISPFFQKFLLYELHQEAAEGFESESDLSEFVRDDFGISLAEGDFGFCDPQHSLNFEKDYFTQKAFNRLTELELLGTEAPVDWLEWQRDLNHRLIERINP